MDTSVPQMHAEAGFEVDEAPPPLLISGFLCLLFGVLSILSPIGRPMLLLPLISFVLGFVALKRSEGLSALGTRAALVGLVLAAGFGMCGLMLPLLKTMTLGSQAEKFARYYIEVVALEENEFGMELSKDYVNRFPETMSLKEHYEGSEDAYEHYMEFRDNSIHNVIRSRGPNAEWALDRPIRIYYSFGRQHAELVWMDPTGEVDSKIYMIMDYRIDPEGQGQWHMATVLPLTERHVAESVL